MRCSRPAPVPSRAAILPLHGRRASFTRRDHGQAQGRGAEPWQRHVERRDGSQVFPLSNRGQDALVSPVGSLVWAARAPLDAHPGRVRSRSNDDIKQLLPNLAEVKPTILVAVPRIFNRVYEAVRSDIASRPAPRAELSTPASAPRPAKARGEHVGLSSASSSESDDKLIFKKNPRSFRRPPQVRAERQRGAQPRGRAIRRRVGIDVYEGYGLTETSPMVSAEYPSARPDGQRWQSRPGCSRRDRHRSGRDGQRCARPSEIVVYGPNVMQGYHNRPRKARRSSRRTEVSERAISATSTPMAFSTSRAASRSNTSSSTACT